jgi:hypothetical protein
MMWGLMDVVYLLLTCAIVGAIIHYLAWRNCDPSKIPYNKYVFKVDENERTKISNASVKFPTKPLQVQTARKEKYVIIGAGFSGMGISVSMLRNNIPFDVVEQVTFSQQIRVRSFVLHVPLIIHLQS